MVSILLDLIDFSRRVGWYKACSKLYPDPSQINLEGMFNPSRENLMQIARLIYTALCLCSLLCFAGCESDPSTPPNGEVSCTEGGESYAVGDNWTCSDGCNSCYCGEGGGISSTDLDCSSGSCTPEECGPEPGMPNSLCEDGVTMAGPGDCEPQENGSCGWTIVECPDPCDDLDCWPCVNGECVPEDEACEPGESFDAADGCNSCVCPESGIMAEASCTEMACESSCGSSEDCLETQFCDFPYDECGVSINSTMSGTCQTRPETCDSGGVGACGCDGTFRTNDCELQSIGTDYQIYGGCESPDAVGEFLCGTTRCNSQSEMCNISMNDMAGEDGEPDFYSNCGPLPDNCAQGDCSCVDTACATECMSIHGFTTVFYPGG